MKNAAWTLSSGQLPWLDRARRASLDNAIDRAGANSRDAAEQRAQLAQQGEAVVARSLSGSLTSTRSKRRPCRARAADRARARSHAPDRRHHGSRDERSTATRARHPRAAAPPRPAALAIAVAAVVGTSDLRRILAMRLLAAARLAPSAARRSPTRCSRASKSSNDAGRVASTASNISVLMPLSAARSMRARAFRRELVDLGADAFAMLLDAGDRLQPDGAVDQLDQIQIEPMLEHDAQQADGRAPQRNSGCWRASDRWQRCPRAYRACRRCDRIADARARQGVTGTARQIVLADRLATAAPRHRRVRSSGP